MARSFGGSFVVVAAALAARNGRLESDGISPERMRDFAHDRLARMVRVTAGQCAACVCELDGNGLGPGAVASNMAG
jgi:hypothetical protein